MSASDRENIQSPIILLRAILHYLPSVVHQEGHKNRQLSFNLAPLVAISSFRNYLAPHIFHKIQNHILNSCKKLDDDESEQIDYCDARYDPCCNIILNAPTICFIHTIDVRQYASVEIKAADFLIRNSSKLRLREFRWVSYHGRLNDDLVLALSQNPTLETIEIDVGASQMTISPQIGFKPLAQQHDLKHSLKELKLFLLSESRIPGWSCQIASFRNLERLTLSHLQLVTPELEELRLMLQELPRLQKLSLPYFDIQNPDCVGDVNQLGDLVSELCPGLTEFDCSTSFGLESNSAVHWEKIVEDILGGLEFLEIFEAQVVFAQGCWLSWDKVVDKRCQLLQEKEDRSSKLRVSSRKRIGGGGEDLDQGEIIKNKTFQFSLRKLFLPSFLNHEDVDSASSEMNIGVFLAKYCPRLETFTAESLSLLSLKSMADEALKLFRTTTTVKSNIIDSFHSLDVGTWILVEPTSTSASHFDCLLSLKIFKNLRTLRMPLLQDEGLQSNKFYKRLFQQIREEWESKLECLEVFSDSTSSYRPFESNDFFEGIALLAPTLKSLRISDWNCESFGALTEPWAKPLAAIASTLTALNLSSSELFPSTFEDICDILPNLEVLRISLQFKCLQQEKPENVGTINSDNDNNNNNNNNNNKYAMSDFIDIISSKFNKKLHRLQEFELHFTSSEPRKVISWTSRTLACKMRDALLKHPSLTKLSIPRAPFARGDEEVRAFTNRCVSLGIDFSHS